MCKLVHAGRPREPFRIDSAALNLPYENKRPRLEGHRLLGLFWLGICWYCFSAVSLVAVPDSFICVRYYLKATSAQVFRPSFGWVLCRWSRASFPHSGPVISTGLSMFSAKIKKSRSTWGNFHLKLDHLAGKSDSCRQFATGCANFVLFLNVSDLIFHFSNSPISVPLPDSGARYLRSRMTCSRNCFHYNQPGISSAFISCDCFCN